MTWRSALALLSTFGPAACEMPATSSGTPTVPTQTLPIASDLPPISTSSLVETFRAVCIEAYPDLGLAIRALEEQGFVVTDFIDWSKDFETGKDSVLYYDTIPDEVQPLTLLQSTTHDVTASVGALSVSGFGNHLYNQCELFGTTTDLQEIGVSQIWRSLGLSPVDHRLVQSSFRLGGLTYDVRLGSTILERGDEGTLARIRCREDPGRLSCNFVHLIVAENDE